MVNIKDLQKNFSAIITPFKSDETVNYDVFEKLLDFQIGQGVEGFYCCGSSGEGLLLSIEERKQITRLAVKTANGKVPVIAHVGTIRTADAIALAVDAEKNGATAVSLIPPYYYNFSIAEICSYYKEVTAACNLPVIVYNIPQFTHFTFTKDTIKELFEDDRIIGIKHTCQDIYALERMKDAYPNKIYFNGFDEIYLNCLCAGVTAAVGTSINIQAPLFAKVRESFTSGGINTAQLWQSKINYVIETLCKHGIFSAVKYIETLFGYDCGMCRSPFASLSNESKKELTILFDVIQGYLNEV